MLCTTLLGAPQVVQIPRKSASLTACSSRFSSGFKLQCVAVRGRVYARRLRLANQVMAADRSFLGIDFGTSGARATLIDEEGSTLVETRAKYDEGSADALPGIWEKALTSLITDIPEELRSTVVSIAIDGTSATAMLIDRETGDVLAAPLMYNEACPEALPLVKDMAPAGHTVIAGTSTLSKLVNWEQTGKLASKAAVLSHQADWLGYLLHEEAGLTDYHNALKLGYDPAPEVEAFPSWMTDKTFASALPAKVAAPGEPVATVSKAVASKMGLPENAVVCGGTTDSIAAFYAANVSKPGQAVTSLGSTLAMKLISTVRVDKAENGIYSHRFGDMWLVGGASNTGGAVLRELFTDAQLKELSAKIDPQTDSGLDFYPLTKPGERFPVNDPELQPRLEPRPDDDALFLHGILESVARIEGKAFALLKEDGASALTEVYTAGGGASNQMWIEMRSRVLGVPVYPSPNVEASYGAALLARSTFV